MKKLKLVYAICKDIKIELIEVIKGGKTIDISKARKVIESIYRKHILTPLHIKEQVILRTVLAKECVKNKKCTFCGCAMEGNLDKRYIDAACEKKYEKIDLYCYDELMNKEQWAVYKQTINFDEIYSVAKTITNDLPIIE